MELPTEIWDTIVKQSKMTITDVIAETDIEKLRDIHEKIKMKLIKHDEMLLSKISIGDIVNVVNTQNCINEDDKYIIGSIYNNSIYDNRVYLQFLIPDTNGRIFGKYRREFGCGAKITVPVNCIRVVHSVIEQKNHHDEYLKTLSIGKVINFTKKDGGFFGGRIEKMYSKYVMVDTSIDKVYKHNIMINWD
jgi:hypothetical protein